MLFCKINGKDKTKALIFNGHVDTDRQVIYKNAGIMNHFGWFVDNKLFGLGASDMKFRR